MEVLAHVFQAGPVISRLRVAQNDTGQAPAPSPRVPADAEPLQRARPLAGRSAGRGARSRGLALGRPRRFLLSPAEPRSGLREKPSGKKSATFPGSGTGRGKRVSERGKNAEYTRKNAGEQRSPTAWKREGRVSSPRRPGTALRAVGGQDGPCGVPAGTQSTHPRAEPGFLTLPAEGSRALHGEELQSWTSKIAGVSLHPAVTTVSGFSVDPYQSSSSNRTELL